MTTLLGALHTPQQARKESLFIYRLSQDINNYDTYDSAVVIAKNENDARIIHPNIYHREGSGLAEWVNPTDVHVTLVGVASDEWKEGDVVIASYRSV